MIDLRRARMFVDAGGTLYYQVDGVVTPVDLGAGGVIDGNTGGSIVDGGNF